jgi:hypothetical protein
MPLTDAQHFAISKRPGWCGPNKRVLIADGIAALGAKFGRPLECLEIGVYGGQSLLAAGFGLFRCQAKGRLVGVDPYLADAGVGDQVSKDSTVWWGGSDQGPEEVLAGTMAAIKENGLEPIVSLYRKRSAEIANEVPTLDYLHIDGDHSAESARQDWEIFGAKVRPGGLVVVDDIDWHGVKTILPDVERKCRMVLMSMSKRNGCSAWGLYEVK